jgi:hypothetical protein
VFEYSCYLLSIFFAGKKLGNNGASNMGSIEESWQAFFANPVDWWDNRKNKVRNNETSLTLLKRRVKFLLPNNKNDLVLSTK